MNKIISANIHGFIFPIDEKAYEKLSQYLDALRMKINNSETFTDIENRIAELFDHYLKSGVTAILETHVNEVIAQIGSIDEIETEETNNQTTQDTNKQSHKKLYRNPDDKFLFGVCGGLGAYFGISSNLTRIIVFILFFGSLGTFLLVYSIMVIMVPEANTPSEKLEMNGEPVNFENIGKVVNSNIKNAIHNQTPAMKSNLKYISEKVAKIAAAIMLIILFGAAIPTIVTIILSAGTISFVIESMQQYIFLGVQTIFWPLVATFFLFFIPFIHLIYGLFRILLNGKKMFSPIKIMLNSVWIFSFLYLIYVSSTLGRDFSHYSEHIETIQCNTITSDSTLYIQSNHAKFPSSTVYKNETDENSENLGYRMKNHLSNGIELTFAATTEKKPFITLIKKSRGRFTTSQSNAKDIEFHVQVDSNHISLDHLFSLGNHPWRNQKITIVVNVPVGVKVKIDKSCENMLTLDSDEISKEAWSNSEFSEIESTSQGITIIR